MVPNVRIVPGNPTFNRCRILHFTESKHVSVLQALHGLPHNLIVPVLAATGLEFIQLLYMVPVNLIHIVCEIVPFSEWPEMQSVEPGT
jgi:hypothetical protein